jgi:lipid A 3-O-deacylase
MVASVFIPVKAQADEALRPEVAISAGMLDSRHSGHEKWMASLEYRFTELKWNVSPWIGAAHAEGSTKFASAGMLWTFADLHRLRISAGVAPTYYETKNGPDLGSDFEFHSFIEAGCTFGKNQVLSIRFGHLSNCGIGSSNPGTETLQLSYSILLP